MSKNAPAGLGAANSEHTAAPTPPPERRKLNGKPRGGQLQPGGSRRHLYSLTLAHEICRRVAAGETLAAICADPGIPVTTGAVRQWIVDDRDAFSCGYASARRQQIEAWSDELLAITAVVGCGSIPESG